MRVKKNMDIAVCDNEALKASEKVTKEAFKEQEFHSNLEADNESDFILENIYKDIKNGRESFQCC